MNNRFRITVVSSAVWCLLLLLRQTVLKHCSNRIWLTLLWFSALFFLLPIPDFCIFWTRAGPINRINFDCVALVEIPLAPEVNGVSYSVEYSIFWLFYLLGATLSVFKTLLDYRLHRRRLLSACSASETLYTGRRKINLITTRAVDSPESFGWLHPIIVLPECSWSMAERELVIRHEMTHITRCDPWKLLLLTILVAVNWYNPLAYQLRRCTAQALEIECDRAVTREMEQEQKLDYCSLLLRFSAIQIAASLTFRMSAGANTLQRRFYAIMEPPTKRKPFLIIFAVLLLLAAGISINTLLTPNTASSAQAVVSDDTDYIPLSSADQERQESSHSLSEQGSVRLTGTAETVQVALGQLSLITESGQITVTNNSEYPLEILLYHEEELDTAIQQNTVKPGKSLVFSNLTSANTYRIGVRAAETSSSTFEVIIAD